MTTFENHLTAEPMEEEFYVFPASFGQQRFWFLDELLPGNPLYNIHSTVRLEGTLDRVALEQSLQEIVDRHESLRTTFLIEDGELMQLIAPSLTLPLSLVDLEGLAEPVRMEEAMRLAREEAERPFDLQQGPLLRAALLRIRPEEHLLLLTMHHIISDGWSMGVFIREMAVLYEAFCAENPSPLPEPAIQYADYSHWQREWLDGGVADKQLDYWGKQLGGSLPVLQLPTDRPRPAVQKNRGAVYPFSLPKSVSTALVKLGQQEGATLYMTLLAAFQVLLYRYTGQEDILVGSPSANRNRPEFEGLIGLFINTLVFRTDLSGECTFRELLKRVQKVTLEAYSHQDVPFEKVVDRVQPERNCKLFAAVSSDVRVAKCTDAAGGIARSDVDADPCDKRNGQI